MLLRARWLAFTLVFVACSSALQGIAERDSSEPRIERRGTLPPEIAESSGVAVSRDHPGVLWTHNDSGDAARLYAVTETGQRLATFDVVGARAQDWEDVALGACPRSPGSCLFLADVGDNAEKRPFVVVYLVPEPRPPARPTAARLQTARARALRVTYSDGPHDVEAAAFDAEGALLLVAKGRTSPIRVYRVARADLAKSVAVAEPVDELPFEPMLALGRVVTGAALAPSRTRLVVRTYTALHFFRWDVRGRMVEDGPPCWLGLEEPQGEAVDFLDEHTLILTSEANPRLPGPILRVTCPATPRR